MTLYRNLSTAADCSRPTEEHSMQYRPLGRTGVTVSQLCLGAMMFGAFGNPDHDQ